jgi:hypothetical protein
MAAVHETLQPFPSHFSKRNIPSRRRSLMHNIIPAIITVAILAAAVLLGFVLEARRISSVISGDELKPRHTKRNAKNLSRR